MSFGKKESKNKTPQITLPAPPQITEYEFRTPLGDVFRTRSEGSKHISESDLGGFSRDLVSQSQAGILDLSRQLNRTDAQRATDIRQRANDLFQQQAEGIHRDADDIFKKVRSTLANRFGGSFQSTFGNDLLARIEGNRLSELADARRRANLLGEELSLSDEDSRIRRTNTFFSLLNQLQNQAQGASNTGTDLLMDETRRASDVALARARMLENAMDNDGRRIQRQSVLSQLLTPAGFLTGSLIGGALGNPFTGGRIGAGIGQAGSIFM